jgi:hypothetical protein
MLLTLIVNNQQVNYFLRIDYLVTIFISHVVKNENSFCSFAKKVYLFFQKQQSKNYKDLL